MSAEFESVLSEADSWARVRSAAFGRLAVMVDGHPEIFPVNHVVDHGSVVFRTAAGTKLAAAVGQRVAFEVDGYEPETAVAWSVVIKGVAREIAELYESIDAAQLPLDVWHPTPKPRIVRVEPTAISGRQYPRAALTGIRRVAAK